VIIRDAEEKVKIISEVGEEVIGEDELKTMLDSDEQIYAYDGFEPSGQIHIAQAVLRAINVNKITSTGVKFKMFVADWHAWANNKMGGDLEKIQTVGKYFIEVWKAVGMDLDNVEFVWASDILKDDNYWKIVMNIARETTLKRVLRTTQIMGREDTESLYSSQIFYPCMQAADIFYLGAKICQLGMDQRKVNMLAREVGPKLGYYKPVVVSHHMLMGLSEPAPSDSSAVEKAIARKMSKSKPNTAIFMNDTTKDITKKINKAYCPEGVIEENPILEYCKFLVFEKFDKIVIERPEKWGGNLEFNSYDEVEKAFATKELHPMDLKQGVAKYVDLMIKPVREHFENDETAKALFEKVKSYQITR
jgi:tyrosyl-tRNA synthetase